MERDERTKQTKKTDETISGSTKTDTKDLNKTSSSKQDGEFVKSDSSNRKYKRNKD